MRPQILDRLLLPVLIPVGVLVFIVAVLYSLSRILLAAPDDVAPPIAIGVATFILLAASYVATQPITRQRIVLFVAVPAVLLIGGGVWGEMEYDGAEVEDAGEGHIELNVSMGDNFFDANAIEVAAGVEVTFKLTNNGVAIHNMRIAGPDGVYDTADDAVSDPDLLRGGGGGALTHLFEKAGEISFRCDFHPTEMIGTIRVTG